MDLDFLKNRRTIRRYKKEDISDELLNELLEAAFRVSNTGNMQVYSVVVTRDDENKKKVGPCTFQPTERNKCSRHTDFLRRFQPVYQVVRIPQCKTGL